MTAKVPPASNRDGLYSKDDVTIDLDTDVVWCPADFDTSIMRRADGSGIASFGKACRRCPLRERCTTSRAGRTIGIARHEAQMQQAKTDQAAPDWQAAYRATRPKVERKIGHLTRRVHGGRKARCRGVARVLTDFVTRAAAINPGASRHPRPPLRHHQLGHPSHLISTQINTETSNEPHTPNQHPHHDHPAPNNTQADEHQTTTTHRTGSPNPPKRHP